MSKLIKRNAPKLVILCVVVIAIVVCFPFLNGNNDDRPQSILIAVVLSVAVSLLMILVEQELSIYLRRRGFSYLIRDDYKSYSFLGKTDDEIKYTSTTLSTSSNKVRCEIAAGCDCDLEIKMSANDGINDWEWRGLITMTSSNTGEIAYYHTKDSNLSENGINSFGYKRLTAFKHDDRNEVRIMISQNDKNDHFGREVLIATISEMNS